MAPLPSFKGAFMLIRALKRFIPKEYSGLLKFPDLPVMSTTPEIRPPYFGPKPPLYT